VRLPAPLRPPWHNAFPLAPGDVARIVGADIAALAGCAAARLGEGWDFTTFVVDARIVFRFPKRRQCVRPQKREIEMLARLAPRVAASGCLAIPDYRWIVERSREFPLPYAGYPLLHGRPLVDIAAADCDAGAIAESVGRLLALVRASAPTKPPRPMPDDFSAPDVLHDLGEAAPAMPKEIVAACRALLEHHVPPPTSERVFSHGDLGVEHILVDDDARAVAVIDWGDIGFAHNAFDFVGLWAWGGDAVAARAAEAAHATLTPEHRRYMRFRGICYAIGTIYYGYKDGHEALCRSGLEWLARAFANGQIEDPSRPDG